MKVQGRVRLMDEPQQTEVGRAGERCNGVARTQEDRGAVRRLEAAVQGRIFLEVLEMEEHQPPNPTKAVGESLLLNELQLWSLPVAPCLRDERGQQKKHNTNLLQAPSDSLISSGLHSTTSIRIPGEDFANSNPKMFIQAHVIISIHVFHQGPSAKRNPTSANKLI
ncbi:hypothetical protein CRENBAI_009397 [Crenichthys baileyi]|uniref:Uncharacterized protein n=1 Tax=Crenichthys baileyi TaxID=28760 RepID=A0AAV9S6C2_9TELE